MFANAMIYMRLPSARTERQPTPRAPRPGPVFIGDAVQPWAGETMLLSLMRDDARKAMDQSEE